MGPLSRLAANYIEVELGRATKGAAGGGVGSWEYPKKIAIHGLNSIHKYTSYTERGGQTT